MTRTAAPVTAAPATSAPAPTPPRVRSAAWFTVPFLLAYGLFFAWPAVYGLWTSFTDANLTGHGGAFIGFANYAEAFTDPDMWSALGNTLFFTVITTVPLVVVALVMALLVATGLPGQWIYRLSFFAPYLLASAVVAALWFWIYQPSGGLATAVFTGLGVTGEIGWLTDADVAMWSIAITTVWWTVGFNFLLYLAAIQTIPDHLYEAAALDGAGALRRTWSITLPMLSRTTGLIVLLQVLASLKVFDQIYLMTSGGPDGATRSTIEYVYDTAFTGYRLGHAAGVSVIFFALIILVSLVRTLRTSREG